MKITKSQIKRSGLISYLGKKTAFTAELAGFGSSKNNKLVKTAVLINIKDEEGRILADHLWVKVTEDNNIMRFNKRNVISFIAEAVEYYYTDYRGKLCAKYSLTNIVGAKTITEIESIKYA